jgi:hypothetical protein
MIRPEFKKALEDQQPILILLWIFFFGAIFVYLWLTEFILGKAAFSAGSAFAETVRIVLWLLGFVDLGTYIWWRNRFLTREGILARSKKYKVLQVLQEHKNSLEERAAEIVSSYVTSKIVAFAIIEAMAVYGFVLAFIGAYVRDQYLFSFASGALLLLEFPSKAFLNDILRELETQGV